MLGTVTGAGDESVNKIDKNVPALDEFVFPDSTSELMCFCQNLPVQASYFVLVRFALLCLAGTAFLFFTNQR